MPATASPTASERPSRRHRRAGRQPELFGREEMFGGAPGAPEDLASYDRYVVAFSGGKDSTACLIRLLESEGVARENVELWHHDVDGSRTDSDPAAEGYVPYGAAGGLMDWPCTPGYCRAFAEALGLPIYFSWREGGFGREMLRSGERTAPMHYQMPSGRVGTSGGKAGPKGTRRRFPQVSADLTVRWCSSALKIGVADAALRGQERFESGPEERAPRTLFLTGERAEESAARSRYSGFEPHRADLREGKRRQRHTRATGARSCGGPRKTSRTRSGATALGPIRRTFSGWDAPAAQRVSSVRRDSSRRFSS